MELLKDKTGHQERTSLSRVVAFGIFLILSAVIVLHVLFAKQLPWEFFIAYPTGVSLAYAPQLFLRILETVKDIVVTYKGGVK